MAEPIVEIHVPLTPSEDVAPGAYPFPWIDDIEETLALGAEDRAFVEHEAILAAVAARDPDRARLRMATHLLGLEDSATGVWAPANA